MNRRFFMKKSTSFLLLFLLMCSVPSCRPKEIPPTKGTVAKERETPAKLQKNNPKTYKGSAAGKLLWPTGIPPVQYQFNRTIEETTETYVRELTDPKYQGRSGGSEGNCKAANWLAEQFEQAGLLKLPSLNSWNQNYPTTVTSVLPGEAFLIAPDGTETKLVLGKEWIFRASPEEIDITVSLSTDPMLYSEGNAIWDASENLRSSTGKLSLTVGEVSDGINYTNASGNPSRIIVTENIYEQLKQEGYRIHLRLPDAIDEHGTASNVIGYLPGKDSSKAVVLGANFDGSGQCGSLLMPGAYNNASGVATLIQTATWLAKSTELPCDVIFAAFNTEDHKANGSSSFSDHLTAQYEQIRMINLKCIGWKEKQLTVYGASSEAPLRKSLAGGLGLPYVDKEMGGDELAFRKDNMSSVTLFQDACLSDPEVSSVLNSTHDVAENLDFAMLDDIAKKLAAWVVERGDEPLVSYVVYW